MISYAALILLTDIPNQLKESSIIPLSSGLGGTVFFLVVTISISIAIILKTRKNILSQKVDTQHFTQPPAGRYINLPTDNYNYR